LAAQPLILAYHAVSSAWRSPLAVSETVLERQLRHLRSRGYVGLTLSEAERRRLSGTLPPRSAVFTFDDGYASTLRALPILAEHGFPGTVFLVTGFLDGGRRLSWFGIDEPDGNEPELRSLSWQEAETLQAAGWEIGSHTQTHPLLTSLDDDACRWELESSRAAIEERLGACEVLAYPYGVADRRVAEAARRSGYRVGVTLSFVQLRDEPLLRSRTGLGTVIGGWRLRVLLSRTFFAARRSPAARQLQGLRRHRPWRPE
jgi:peptidoglycan/xylan/chitin deacetylase (PgdA/CDA1 family)